MSTIVRGMLCASLLFAFTAVAQNSGPASNGDFQFDLTGATGAIEFDARSFGSSARGEMTFTGTIEISNEDVDGEGVTTSTVSDVTMTVHFDCLRINGNRAAIGGVVASSSVPEHIGLRALLAVEDNGEGKKAADLDKFTWGLYREPDDSWLPIDAEDPADTGATLTWFATDSEREDDTPIPAGYGVSQNAPVDCQTFSFGSYAFEAVLHGAGNIQVKP